MRLIRNIAILRFVSLKYSSLVKIFLRVHVLKRIWRDLHHHSASHTWKTEWLDPCVTNRSKYNIHHHQSFFHQPPSILFQCHSSSYLSLCLISDLHSANKAALFTLRLSLLLLKISAEGSTTAAETKYLGKLSDTCNRDELLQGKFGWRKENKLQLGFLSLNFTDTRELVYQWNGGWIKEGRNINRFFGHWIMRNHGPKKNKLIVEVRLTVFLLFDRFAPENFACWDLSAVRICNKGKVMWVYSSWMTGQNSQSCTGQAWFGSWRPCREWQQTKLPVTWSSSINVMLKK